MVAKNCFALKHGAEFSAHFAFTPVLAGAKSASKGLDR
jgi:hypothetical protein